MEKIGDDVLGLVLQRVSDWADRKSCSEVCKQWAKTEGLTRTSIRVLEPNSLPCFLTRFPNLTTFETDRMISDSSLKLVAKSCPHLQTLNLGIHRRRRPVEQSGRSQRYDVGLEGLRTISTGCRHLAKLSLRRRKQIRDTGVITLVESLNSLSFLDLSRCGRVTDRAVEAMGAMRSLSVLLLRGCSLITDVGLASLATGSPSRTLKKLDLSECDQITDDGVSLLRYMSSLQELSLAECGPRVTDTGIFAIAVVCSLRMLDLSWLVNLSDATLVALSENCPSLVEINVTGCELMTGAGLRSFLGHRSLEIFVLVSCCNVCADDVEQLVCGCKRLRYLGLDRGLRGWVSTLLQVKLNHLCRIDWI